MFDWDQTDDYEAVESIVKGKLRLIGPRVTSDTGFFLAPWHYYFLLPFYLISHGSLDMGFWGALLIQYLTVMTAFFLAKKWFGKLAGIMVGLSLAVPSNITAWGFMYVPLLSLWLFDVCLKTLEDTKWLPWLFLLLGIGCTTYAVFYALWIPFLYVIYQLVRTKKVNFRNIIAGLTLFCIPYLPLVIFDLRHDFLNIRNVLSFATNQRGQGVETGYFIKVFFRAIEMYWLDTELPRILSVVIVAASLGVLVFGGTNLFNKKRGFMCWWLVSSLIPMAFYKGNVSEYYYAPVILLIPFCIAGLLVKNKLGKKWLIVLMVGLACFRLINKTTRPIGISLEDKKRAVFELEKIGEQYSVSYDFNIGDDSGYSLVFKKLGKNYVDDGSAQLYTLTYKNLGKMTSGIKVAETNKIAIFKR